MTSERTRRKQLNLPSATKLGMRITPKRLGWDVGKALQLRIVKHLSYSQIGSLLKVTDHTVREGLKPLLSLLQHPQAITAFRENEAEILDSIRLLAAQGIGEQLSDPKRRKSMDMSRLSVLYGIMFDKQRLMRGESTAIVHQLTAIISAAHKREKKQEPLDVTPDGDESTQAQG